ncbi:MAG: polymer-forming cytoskeletal protein [Myxococcota bacterium]
MSEQLQAFLDSGTSFEGKISFTGVVRIDGHFRGDISAEGLLVIGETGLVEANLQVGSLVVRGTVEGDVIARERVEIAASGDLEGSLHTPVLCVEDGGRLAAKVSMGGTKARPPSGPKASP